MNLLIRFAENTAEISAGASALILLLFSAGKLTRKVYAAQWRSWVWLALAVRLLIPIHFELPQTAVALPAPSPEQGVTVVVPGTRGTGSFSIPDTVSGQERNAYEKKAELIREDAEKRTVPLNTLLAVTWAAGAAGCLLWTLGSSLLFRRRLLRWSSEETDDGVLRLFREERAAAGGGGRVRLMRGKKDAGPMLIGLLCPVLLLPPGLFEDGELRVIFRHELTHFRRRDLWYRLLLAAACAVHWFNPLVWLMARAANRDLELSCDEAALKNADPAFRAEYGRAILSVAQKATQRRAPLSTGFGGGKKELKRRLETILNTKKRRRGAAALCVALVLTISCGAFVTYGGTSPDGRKNREKQDVLAQRLLSVRTESIGDNSAVGRVLGALSLPDGMVQGGMALQTNSEPYSLTVRYTAQSDELLTQTDLSWAYRNATLILSLIQNADRVVFYVDAPDCAMTFVYTREQSMKQEQTDVRTLSQGASEMEKFLADLNSRTAEDYQMTHSTEAKEREDLLTVGQAETAVEQHAPIILPEKLVSRGRLVFAGADCYGFTSVLEGKSPQPEQWYAISRDGSAFFVISGSCPVVRNLESAETAVKSGGSEASLTALREQITQAQETLKQAQVELENRRKSGAADYSEQQQKVREAEEALAKAKEEFQNRHTALPPYEHRTDDAVESAVYEALGQFYSEPYTDGNVVINAPVIYGSFEEDGALRVFATVDEAEYELDGEVLNSVGGSRIPMELRFSKDGNPWKLIGRTTAKDGSYFGDSIQDFCAPHGDVAKKMLADYGKSGNFLSGMKKNIQEYVSQTGIGAKSFHSGGKDYLIV
ncbi:BlaR1 peptidase M56 [Caprobacter fermentans]|uniref:BlaR1 peptidase M56 n=1 Tax=Caproicibacter fermentans TaxID=2576756 RepID=A0A6N8HVJ9_9FIRM|nr:M56 family metallopeptidase [Caproicibacter fermentans]MVB09709.1 BlaR1 peptidase M56 [Caproicibacter fermentans]